LILLLQPIRHAILLNPNSTLLLPILAQLQSLKPLLVLALVGISIFLILHHQEVTQEDTAEDMADLVMLISTFLGEATLPLGQDQLLIPMILGTSVAEGMDLVGVEVDTTVAIDLWLPQAVALALHLLTLKEKTKTMLTPAVPLRTLFMITPLMDHTHTVLLLTFIMEEDVMDVDTHEVHHNLL
jgi:hypothetical protein